MNKFSKPVPANGTPLSRKPAPLDRANPPYDRADHLDHLPPPPPDESYWAALLNDSDLLSSALSHEDNYLGDGGHPEESIPSARSPQTWVAENASLEGKGTAPEPTEHDWDTADRVFAQDYTVDLVVVGYNRGGLLVEWGSLRGFVPASQLIDAPHHPEVHVNARRAQLITYLNQPLTLRIIELDRLQNRLILSERAAQVRPGTRAVVLENLQVGETLIGRVTNLCDFGAFVDLGGLEGLIHISELAEGHFLHPRNVIREGDHVRARILNIDGRARRLGLSLR